MKIQKNKQLFSTSLTPLIRISILYVIISTVALGAIQPGYNFWRDTISLLVVGSYGFIQVLNFWILALLAGGVGWTMRLSVRKELRSTFLLPFYGLAFSLFVLSFFPADAQDAMSRQLQSFSSLNSLLHFATLTIMGGVFCPWVIWNLRFLNTTSFSQKKFIQQTRGLAVLGGIFVSIWIWMRMNGEFFEYKGILEKVAVLVLLLWAWRITLFSWPSVAQKSVISPLNKG